MGQSEGREDEDRDAGAGAVPESVRALHEQGSAADPAHGDELPVFPGQPASAGTLDLAAAADEPMQLIRYLVVAANEHIGFSEHEEEWTILLRCFTDAKEKIAKLQEPASHRGAKASPS